jgi:hypothetical protein
MRITIILLLLLATLMPASNAQKEHTDYVPDQKTAARVAQAILRAKFGDERVNALLPLTVDGSNNVPYFRIYDLRSTYATRLSAGGVADEWVTQLLRQGDSQVFKRYSQMKLQMKREALEKINRQANEMPMDSGTAMVQ